MRVPLPLDSIGHSVQGRAMNDRSDRVSGLNSAASTRTIPSPASRLPIQAVTVFCAASDRGDPAHREMARTLGRMMAEASIALVYGGGHVGVMGAIADATLEAGGRVIGIIPEFLKIREDEHLGLTELHVVDSMHERKQRMFDLSQAAVILPGGLGTLDETVEMITWRQLGLHDRPSLIVNGDGYWDPMIKLFEYIYAHNYGHGNLRDLYRVVDRVEDVIPELQRMTAPCAPVDSTRL